MRGEGKNWKKPKDKPKPKPEPPRWPPDTTRSGTLTLPKREKK